jgi:TRAP-type C4-dicarboxylate transport system substrate-binding protein
MTRRLLIGVLLSTAVVAAACGDANKAGGDRGGSSDAVLTFANPGNALDIGPYLEAVQTRSSGSIELDVKRDWRADEIDSEARTLQEVRDGRIDMASIGARAFAAEGVKAFEPLVAPFQLDSYELQRRVLASPAADRMLASVKQLGLVGIALLPGELRRPLGVSRAFLGPSDYRDAAFGIRPADMAMRTAEALGARPEERAVTSDISTVDVVEQGVLGIDGRDYDSQARALTTNVVLWPRAVVVVINRKAYDHLTADQRDALAAAGRASVDSTAKWTEGNDAQAVSDICKRGRLEMRAASAAQLDELRAAVGPLVQELEHNEATRASQREIEALARDAQPADVLTCPRPAEAPATAEPTPLDGIWVMDSDARQLADAMGTEINAPDIVPENWGHLTVVLDRGRFAFTEANSQACSWGYGDASVHGDRLELTVDDGGGRTPNNAKNRPGEHFEYEWSLYRDQLTLDPVKGAVSPPGFRVHPWRSLDGEPSLDALSHSCPPPAGALDR